MTIKKLIKLDFYLMKPLAGILVGFLIIPIMLGFIADVGVSIMITLTFVVFMLNIVFATAEKSNFAKLYSVLPIKRSQSILSRYLFSLIVLFLASLISLIIFICISYVIHKTIIWTNGVMYLSAAVVVAIFFISIQYPFYFKFEYSKAAIMAILPYLICFAIGAPLMQHLMKNASFFASINKIITYFQANPAILSIGALLISVILILISYSISLLIQKKDIN